MSSRRALLLTVLSGLLFSLPAAAQRRVPFETAEPPLADGSNPIQQAAVREPMPLPPSVRMLDAPAPVVQLRVLAPPVVAVGKEVELRLVVENASRLPAHQVLVAYPTPAGVEVKGATPQPAGRQGDTLVWNLETLAAGARKEIQLKLQPPAGAAELDSRPRVQYAFEQAAKTRLARPALTLRKTGPEQAQQHDILVFGLEVTNTGGIELTDVQVTDALPQAMEHRPDTEPPAAPGRPPATGADRQSRTWAVGRLRPGETRRLQYHVSASATGPIEHGGLATAAGGAVKAEAPKVKVHVRELQLDLQVVAPPREAATRPARVQIKLRNLSPRQLENIVVTDQILQSCKLDAISSGGQQFNDRVQWIVQSLRPHETRTLELLVRNAAGGPVAHRVTAGYRELTRTAEAATEFDATPSLTWDVRGAPPVVEVNGEVTYTLTVRNTGAGPATNVRPAVTLPDEMALLKAQPVHRAQGSRVEFDPITLPAGGVATFHVQAKGVRPSVAARVTAELAAPDVFTSGPVQKQEVTAIGGAGPR